MLRREERVFLETYPIYEPYVYAGVTRDESGLLKYYVIEPTMEEGDIKFMERIKVILKYEIYDLDVRELDDPKKAESILRGKAIEVIRKYRMKVPKMTFEKTYYYLTRNLLGYGKIDPLMKDPQIEDISCDGPGIPVYIWHRRFESMPTNVKFESEEELEKMVVRLAYLAEKHISVAQPMVDASLPDGSRIQLTYGKEVTKKGSTFTVRKFREEPFSIIDLINFNTLNAEIASLIWYVIEHRASILVAGGTASGKTTTINAISMFIKPESKVVTIEDTLELNLAHENWIQLVTRPSVAGMGEISLFDLLKASLRQRPDFIIVGEVRGTETYTLFQAISTGHAGISSIHADSIEAVTHRLISEPMNIPKFFLPSINYVLLEARLVVKGLPARRIIKLIEIIGLDQRTGELLTNDVYRYEPRSDGFIYMGRSYVLERMVAKMGRSMEEVKKELERRKTVLEWMASKNIRKYKEVVNVIRRYYVDPEVLLNEISMEIGRV